jgi:hypothetical protein
MTKQFKTELCSHGFTYGYCPVSCIKFTNLKEKIGEERRLFLKQFKQTPKSVKHLKARKHWCRMNPVTKITFIAKLLEYNRLERQAKY